VLLLSLSAVLYILLLEIVAVGHLQLRGSGYRQDAPIHAVPQNGISDLHAASGKLSTAPRSCRSPVPRFAEPAEPAGAVAKGCLNLAITKLLISCESLRGSIG
jgi:hypothetical protein